MIFSTDKELIVDPTQGLYKWSKIFNRLQRNFFEEEFELRRERQIHDFLLLNEFKNVHYITDTDVFVNARRVEIEQADIIVITDQKFSRYPCPVIIKNIQELIKHCPIYLCLNRHYINIDNSYRDKTLNENFPIAITQWLKKSLDATVVDLSLNYVDYGNAFTWAIPDRHYYICQN
jgi:hypothetical protein